MQERRIIIIPPRFRIHYRIIYAFPTKKPSFLKYAFSYFRTRFSRPTTPSNSSSTMGKMSALQNYFDDLRRGNLLFVDKEMVLVTDSAKIVPAHQSFTVSCGLSSSTRTNCSVNNNNSSSLNSSERSTASSNSATSSNSSDDDDVPLVSTFSRWSPPRSSGKTCRHQDTALQQVLRMKSPRTPTSTTTERTHGGKRVLVRLPTGTTRNNDERTRSSLPFFPALLPSPTKITPTKENDNTNKVNQIQQQAIMNAKTKGFPSKLFVSPTSVTCCDLEDMMMSGGRTSGSYVYESRPKKEDHSRFVTKTKHHGASSLPSNRGRRGSMTLRPPTPGRASAAASAFSERWWDHLENLLLDRPDEGGHTTD